MVSFFYFATFERSVLDGPAVREDRIAGGACRRSRRSVTPSSERIWGGRPSVCITPGFLFSGLPVFLWVKERHFIGRRAPSPEPSTPHSPFSNVVNVMDLG